MPHHWQYSKPGETALWVTWCSERCSYRGIGLDDVWRSLPTKTSLWIYDSMLFCSPETYSLSEHTTAVTFTQLKICNSLFGFFFFLMNPRTVKSIAVFCTSFQQRKLVQYFLPFILWACDSNLAGHYDWLSSCLTCSWSQLFAIPLWAFVPQNINEVTTVISAVQDV